MLELESGKLVNNPELVKKAFNVKSDITVANRNLKIVFPVRYTEIGLAEMGTTVTVVNIFAIILDDKYYSISMAPIMNKLTPSNVSECMIDDVRHMVLEFEQDSVVMPNNNLVRDNGFMFNIFNEFFINGKVPWYVSEDDLSNIFIEAKKYANSKIGDNPINMEIITSIITRTDKDPLKLYRYEPKGKANFVGLNNIYYSFDTTTSKLVGAYFKVGVTSAIINKEKKSSVVGDVLKA